MILAKFGVSATFTVLYISNNRLFPTLFVATACGVCNFIARFLTIFSSIVNEMPEPLPMIVFVMFLGAGIGASCFIKVIRENGK